MKEMVGGCCVCSDERGWAENPLVYCDGHGCNVAVHQACYGIVQVPTGPWFCRKCESQERAARVRCELCPHKDGALKRTDNGGWAHVVCALYIPEVQFANVLTMEPIVLQYVPHDRFNKTCYICEEQGRESKAASGACMACNRHGCRQAFHVTCAQMAGLLCEEEVLEVDNVKYCGYCKYHFSKMSSRHAGSSSFLPGRRSRSASPAQDKPPNGNWIFLGLFQSRKDRERPKQKHKKRPESPSPSSLQQGTTTAEKVQGKGTGDGEIHSEVARAEAKGRKSSSHGSSHKGKKTGSGKSSSCALPASQDFTPFPKLEQEEEKFRKATSSSSSSHCSPLYEGPKADVFEQKVIFSGFGSIMRFSTSSVGQQRARDASPVDYKLPPPSTSHKRMPSLSTEEGEVLKEKKHKGSKKNKHGPGRPKAGKGKEVLGAQLAASTSTSSSPFSGGSLVSSSVGSSSRSFGHPASLPGLSVESPLLGSGIYTSNKDPIPLGAALRAVCSTPLPSGLLPHQGGAALPQLSRSPFASSIPTCSSSAGSTTQVFSLAGSTFTHIDHTLITHLAHTWHTPGTHLAHTWHTPEPDLEDCGFGCRGTSPQESLSSMSPISSLPTLFDQTVSCSSSGQLDNVPQATPNIEQLLEKQGNGEAGVNIVEMLKALHSLQKENQRLQEQIMTLTAKKERLQLLNVQLSVPFPWSPAATGPAARPSTSCLISKSPPCKNSFGIENSLSTSSEDPHSGCPSRSSSSLSFHSTPPPLPMLQPSPASLPLPGAQQVNGLARVAGGGLAGGSGVVPMVDNLLGSLAGAQQMPLNGILGSLNGAQPAQPPPQASGPPALHVASLSPLTEQQRHVLQQHEQQLQQLQQLLTSQPLNPEQQALVFQMMQQIQQKRELQRLQMSGSSQLAMSGLLAATSAPLHSSPSALLTSAAPSSGSLLAPSSGSLLAPSSGSLLASLSPQQLNPGGALLAPQATPPLGSGSAMAQPNPFLSLQPDGGTPKGAVGTGVRGDGLGTLWGRAGTGWDRVGQSGTGWDSVGMARGTGWDTLGQAGTVGDRVGTVWG
uniref:MLLT6, PHD finger containing n=1 Tax=Catharus ustulatus TaxID=91951 RepID=A0A8C3UT88_CATUS